MLDIPDDGIAARREPEAHPWIHDLVRGCVPTMREHQLARSRKLIGEASRDRSSVLHAHATATSVKLESTSPRGLGAVSHWRELHALAPPDPHRAPTCVSRQS